MRLPSAKPVRDEGKTVQIFKKLMTTFVLSLLMGAALSGAHAATKKVRPAFGGDALKPKKSLQFDGRSVESMRSGRYDSYSHLGSQEGSKSRRLYSLPANFQARAADSEMEMRYRQ